MDEGRVRHSVAENAEVVEGDLEKAKQEASNALRQVELVRSLIVNALDGRPFKLRPSTLLDLNRKAIEGLDSFAGTWRPADIGIQESKHVPPKAHLVPILVEELCDYVNDNWDSKSAIHLSAMVMWRVNWIHPFTEGNGRTSRAASYLVLCAHSRMLLSTRRSIPEQVVANRKPYYDALDEADARYKEAEVLNECVTEKIEALIGRMFAVQLREAYDGATEKR